MITAKRATAEKKWHKDDTFREKNTPFLGCRLNVLTLLRGRFEHYLIITTCLQRWHWWCFVQPFRDDVWAQPVSLGVSLISSNRRQMKATGISVLHLQKLLMILMMFVAPYTVSGTADRICSGRCIDFVLFATMMCFSMNLWWHEREKIRLLCVWRKLVKKLSSLL